MVIIVNIPQWYMALSLQNLYTKHTPMYSSLQSSLLNLNGIFTITSVVTQQNLSALFASS
jgi:hypothetical protein